MKTKNPGLERVPGFFVFHPPAHTAAGEARESEARCPNLRDLWARGDRVVAAALEIPTFAELGHSGMEGISWTGIFVASATARPIVARLHADLARILQHPEMRDSIIDSGAEPGGNSPDEFAAFVRADRARMGRMMREANISPE